MCELTNYTFKMNPYYGNFNYLLGLLVLLHVAAPVQLEKATRTAVQRGEASFECQTKSERCSNSEWRQSNKNTHAFFLIYSGGSVLNGSRGKYSVTEDSSSGKCVLVVKNVSMEDSGTYICSLDGNVLLNAELIVFDKYPSELFCSISVRPNERLLGSNVCCLPPDTVEASCEMSFRDDSGLGPYLEWTVGGRIIHANESTRDGGTTVSRVRVSATDQLVCRVKYRNNINIETNLAWSKSINVTVISDTSNWTEVPCAQTIVNCSDIDDATRSYSWVNNNNTQMSENRQLDLKGKPMGTYSCVVTHVVRDKWCSYVVKRINFTCNDTQSIEPGTSASEPIRQVESHNSIVVVLLCVAGVLVVIVICFVWMRNRKARNLLPRANNNEGTNEHLTADTNIDEQQLPTQVASALKE